MSPKVGKADFRTMLTNALKEAIDPRDLPSDPKEIKELARRVVNEYMKFHNTKEPHDED